MQLSVLAFALVRSNRHLSGNTVSSEGAGVGGGGWGAGYYSSPKQCLKSELPWVVDLSSTHTPQAITTRTQHPVALKVYSLENLSEFLNHQVRLQGSVNCRGTCY